MKIACLFLGLLACAAAAAEGDYLDYAIPKDAKAFESNPRPGSDYAVVVSYSVGDERVGVRCYWDKAKTKPYSEELLKKGEKHGIQRTWHANGRLKSESPYRDGVMHGTFRGWDAEGKLLGNFEMDAGTGTWKEWYPNGQLHESKEFKKGKLHGESRLFYEDGKRRQTITFRDDKAHGVSFIWDRDGKLVEGSPLFYLRGERVSKDAYLKAREADPTLPAIMAGEDR
jgi:antitoxin component YwqK of YwqJK toxin-antitoxin module